MKNFKRYLKDGRRVAAFGEKIENEVEIFLLYCSVKDEFNKKYAKEIYSLFYYKDIEANIKPNYILPFICYLGEFNPVILRIPIEEGDSAEYTFKKYIRENFYKKFIVNEYCLREVVTLRKGKESAFILNKGKAKDIIHKMDEYV